MDIKDFCVGENEKPLDKLVTDGGFCKIFRSITCVGDSLASGEFEGTNPETGATTYHDMYEYSWGQFLARMAGITVQNFSRGGMSAAPYVVNFAYENRLWDADKATQAYIIALGINDLKHIINGAIEFGDVSDINLDNYVYNKKTFVGCYAEIIQRYKIIQPKAKFFLMTIPRDFRMPQEKSVLADKHSELLYKLAEIFDNTYVLDMRKHSPEWTPEFMEKYMLGGHMNPMGYALVATMVASYIDYIIRKNPKDFKQVGFIGTPYENTKSV